MPLRRSFGKYIVWCAVLLFSFQTAPISPVATWTAPGQLTIEYAGGVLWYQKPNSPPVFLPCSSPCILRSGGGDAAYSPETGALLFVQNEAGEYSPATVVGPHVVILPVVVVP